jgi:hypothetical protein
LTWWKIPCRAWVIILAELAVIVFLGAGFYSEYLNNSYFQGYVNGLAPILIPVLSVAFGVSSATVATFLYFGMRRITQTQETEIGAPVRKRSQTRRTARTSGISEQKLARTNGESPTAVARPRLIMADPTSAAQPAEAGAGKKDSK